MLVKLKLCGLKEFCLQGKRSVVLKRKMNDAEPLRLNLESSSQSISLNKVLDDIPVGWFHYRLLYFTFSSFLFIFIFRLLLICGLAFMADAMVLTFISLSFFLYFFYYQEVSLLAFISTCADKDWNLSDSQVASITR